MVPNAMQGTLCPLGNDDYLARPHRELVLIDLDGSRAVNSNDQHIDFRIDMPGNSLASGA